LGLLPCPRYHQATKQLFKDASNKLMALSQQYGCCNFIKVHHDFLIGGEVKPSLFKNDGIHLSQEGNAIYCKRIIPYIVALPK
jgi:hypothetical protein